MLRPHATYDNPSHYRTGQGVDLANAERLNDLVFISGCNHPPSSVVFEAYAFTDYLIVFPGEYSDKSVKGLFREIPFAPVIPLNDSGKFIEQIRANLQRPGRKKSAS